MDNNSLEQRAAREIAREVSIWDYADIPREPRSAGGRPVISFSRFDQIQQEPMVPIIQGHLFEDTIGAIIGASGSCKTFLAVSQVSSIVTGTPWYGYDVQQGAVFYLVGEGRRGLTKRFNGWAQHHGVSLQGAPLFISDRLPPLHDQLNTAAVISAMETITEGLLEEAGCSPKLVVVDTFARAMAGRDENTAVDVGRLDECLQWIKERWGCCVEFLHHTGHGENTKGRGRGSSAIYAGLDFEFLVQSDGGPVTVTSTKEKDWPKPLTLRLERQIVDVADETTLVLTPGASVSPAEQKLEERENVRRLLSEGVSIRQIAERLFITKSAVENHKRVLARMGAIGDADDHV